MTDAAVHTGANAEATRPERRSDLDTMGVLIVIGLILFHSAQIFYGGDFFVQNEPWSPVALVAIAFASLWGIPIMFLIAGTSICLSLSARASINRSSSIRPDMGFRT